MAEIVHNKQMVISCKEARAVGKTGLARQTSDVLEEFFNSIVKTVLNDEGHYLIQWGLAKLDDDEMEKLDASENGEKRENN